eukprot:scaffold12067_cov49-Cyclotella_meneghiniana.AAC.3
MGGDNFGMRPLLRFTPRWCAFRLIQRFHSISTLPSGHHNVVFSHGRGQSWLACTGNHSPVTW